MLENINADYSDVIGTFAIPFVVAIFSLSFPLLFQTASRIDDKYNSTLLIKVFRKDCFCHFFIGSIFVSLFSVLLWILQIPRVIDCGEVINNFIDNHNTALILLVISTILLIISTICVMWLMYVYYMPKLLFNRLENQYECSNDPDKKTMLFIAISRLMHYGLKKSDSELSESTLEFYNDKFIAFRNDKKNDFCTYPDEYYQIIYETNELVFMGPKKESSFFNESVMLGLLIDELQKTIISDKTYSEIWRGMRQALFYNREDFILAYWRKAHQYMYFWLDTINPEYDENLKVTNQNDIDRRNMERERFLEFHYAFGGLLLMKQQYSLINKLTSWTNQTPPKYVLVPETMEEVIKKFMEVETKGGYVNPFYYEQRYPFPDVSGVNGNNIIKMWIKRYISILFLRQYTLNEQLRVPNPPKSILEKKKWLAEIDILERYVMEYLPNKECLRQLNLDELGELDWFQKNNKPTPKDLIERLKRELEYSIETSKVNQEIDTKKVVQFNDATKNILANSLNHYEKIFNNKIGETEPHKSFFSRGRYEVMDKMAFAADQDMGYPNFDSLLAEMIVTEFKYNLPLIFRENYKTTYYVLSEKNILPAIYNLQLDCHQYTILSVGVNLKSLESDGVENKEDGLWEYNGISIIELGYTPIDAVNNSLFIIKNEDLPCILYNELNKETIDKYSLKQIDNKFHIYTSVIDLRKNDDFQKEIKNKTNIQTLDKSVLVCVDLNIEVRSRLDAKCIQLKVFSQFENIGNPISPNDVMNIWKLEN